MKKLSLLIAFCIMLSPGVYSQDYTEYLNVLLKIPEFFTNFIAKTESLANQQDKEKYIAMGKDVYRSVDKVILQKQSMIQTIDSSTSRLNTDELNKMSATLGKLLSSLEKSEALANSLGMNTVKFSQEIKKEFDAKSSLLQNLQRLSFSGTDQQKAAARKSAIDNLQKGITILDTAKNAVDDFISKLEESQ